LSVNQGGRGKSKENLTPLHLSRWARKQKNNIMKGITWNCKGIKKGVASFLKKLILDHNFHFICLQETMKVELNDQILRKFDINQAYLWKWIPSKGMFGGIVVGINVRFMDVGSFYDGEYMLQMNLWDKEKREKCLWGCSG
jgi:exonuclease III